MSAGLRAWWRRAWCRHDRGATVIEWYPGVISTLQCHAACDGSPRIERTSVRRAKLVCGHCGAVALGWASRTEILDGQGRLIRPPDGREA